MTEDEAAQLHALADRWSAYVEDRDSEYDIGRGFGLDAAAAELRALLPARDTPNAP